MNEDEINEFQWSDDEIKENLSEGAKPFVINMITPSVRVSATPRLDQMVARAILIRQRVRTPSGRIGVVHGEHDGRIDVQYVDQDGGSVRIKPQLVRFLPP